MHRFNKLLLIYYLVYMLDILLYSFQIIASFLKIIAFNHHKMNQVMFLTVLGFVCATIHSLKLVLRFFE